jgi:SH3-like domain-containing protein
MNFPTRKTLSKRERRNMKRFFILSASFFGFLFIWGCAQTSQQKTMPESVNPYFRPKRVYAVNFDQAWDLTLKGLKDSGIAVAKVDRANALIRTAYQNPTPFVRDQCEIKFLKEPMDKTYIHVSCRYETKAGEDQYRDLTYNYPREVMKLEEDIYRKIEPFILPAERVYVAETAAPPKEGAKPSPAEPPPTTARVVLPPAPGEPQKPIIVEVPIPSTPQKPPPSKEETRSVFPPPRPAVETKPPVSPPAGMATKGEGEKLPKPGDLDWVTVAAANLRSGPSLKNPIVTVMPKGEELQRVNRKGFWTQVQTSGGKSGWVFNDFIRRREASKPAIEKKGFAERPSSKISPPATKSSSIEWKKAPAPSPDVLKESANRKPEVPSKIFLMTKSKAPMMTTPSAKSKLIYVLRQGRKVEKIGESTGWTKVKVSWGDTGWVSSNLLETFR